MQQVVKPGRKECEGEGGGNIVFVTVKETPQVLFVSCQRPHSRRTIHQCISFSVRVSRVLAHSLQLTRLCSRSTANEKKDVEFCKAGKCQPA